MSKIRCEEAWGGLVIARCPDTRGPTCGEGVRFAMSVSLGVSRRVGKERIAVVSGTALPNAVSESVFRGATQNATRGTLGSPGRTWDKYGVARL